MWAQSKSSLHFWLGFPTAQCLSLLGEVFLVILCPSCRMMVPYVPRRPTNPYRVAKGGLERVNSAYLPSGPTWAPAGFLQSWLGLQNTLPTAITRTLGGLCALIKTVLLSSKASSLPSPLAASVPLKVKPSYSTPEKGLNWMLDSFDLTSQSTPLPKCSSVSSTPTL